MPEYEIEYTAPTYPIDIRFVAWYSSVRVHAINVEEAKRIAMQKIKDGEVEVNVEEDVNRYVEISEAIRNPPDPEVDVVYKVIRDFDENGKPYENTERVD